jgi:hypothetical protein
MWIVWLALRRPYTFIVMAILIGILGGVYVGRSWHSGGGGTSRFRTVARSGPHC